MNKKIIKIIQEQVFKKYFYNSFSELTEQDLFDIAEWGLSGEFSSSGAWDEAEEDIEKAKLLVVESFNRILNDEFPEGLKDIPSVLTIYRLITLQNPESFNKKNLGHSWFANPNRINNSDFTIHLTHLRSHDVYLITATTTENNIDIPRTLWQRDINWVENEIVIKDDSESSIKNIYIKKIR